MTFYDHHNDRLIEIKFIASGHVQFTNGNSCSLKDFEMFYGKENRQRIKEYFGK